MAKKGKSEIDAFENLVSDASMGCRRLVAFNISIQAPHSLPSNWLSDNPTPNKIFPEVNNEGPWDVFLDIVSYPCILQKPVCCRMAL
jgi:hypothetical protein